MKLLEESQKHCDFQVIIDVINPKETNTRDNSQFQKTKAKFKTDHMNEIFQHGELLPYQMTRIATNTVKSSKSKDYVPFRNCVRYNRYIELKTNTRNSHFNSYKDLLNFNLNEVGLNYQKVFA